MIPDALKSQAKRQKILKQSELKTLAEKEVNIGFVMWLLFSKMFAKGYKKLKTG